MASGAGRFALRSHRRRTLILAYHDVVPAGAHPCGDRSLHLPQADFAAQLDALAATHDVIPLAAIRDGARGRCPRAIITFDDAYCGALTVGLAEVVKRDLPATVFVSPGLFGRATWWDRLAQAAGGEMPAVIRKEALTAHAGVSDRVFAALGSGADTLPKWAVIATEAEVQSAAALPGITLGAHTWSHPNLAALEPREVLAELERPLAWLRDLGQRGDCWLAYPYGLTSAAVSRAAVEAGYAGALLISGGWLPPALAPNHDLPRFNVPSGMSLTGFRLRACGVLTA